MIVGTAGWSLPRAVADQFSDGASGLERYATRFRGVEINSTFYRPHQPKTYARWAKVTPADFRFALKAPRTITHVARLARPRDNLIQFLDQSAPLEGKRGPILFQLPPSLVFDPAIATEFFSILRKLHDGAVALEPRHTTWFEAEADDLLREFRIGRVAADPPRAPQDRRSGGWPGLAYWRLHGSPRIYYSAYDDARLETLARTLGEGEADETWCIFDNTASGAAADDGLRLLDRLAPRAKAEPCP